MVYLGDTGTDVAALNEARNTARILYPNVDVLSAVVAHADGRKIEALRAAGPNLAFENFEDHRYVARALRGD